MSATAVARNFSAIVTRVARGERIEIVRNGLAIAELHPAAARPAASAERWREVMGAAPPVDPDFAGEIEDARSKLGPPSGAWPS